MEVFFYVKKHLFCLRNVSCFQLRLFLIMALTRRFGGNKYPDEHILSYGSLPVSNLIDEFVCCRFAIQKHQENICAFGTENGKVLICDVTAPIKGTEFVRHRFSAGESAVFDFCFIPERPNLLLSLCGGSRLELWDIERSSSVLFNGHHDSVRCASVWPENPFCVLTGSRDGAILLWDLREKPSIVRKGTDTKKSVSSIREYQMAHEASIPITSILHMSENYFVSSSSSSSSGIRIWDLRYQISSSPIRSLFVPQKMSKESGVASMCWDRFRSSFFALCTDNAIYEYVPSLNTTFPVRSFRAKFVNSFFVQCTASPFSDHLLCGSSFSNAFIWDLQENHQYVQDGTTHSYEGKTAVKQTKKCLPNAKFVLNGHEREIEWVQWSSNGDFMITLDSEIVRIWSRWADRTENGYPTEVVLNHRPLKFVYPKLQTDIEEEVASFSQTLTISQRTFGSESRTDNESHCSDDDNGIQLLMDYSPTRSVFKTLDNLPTLYAQKTEGGTQMEDRQIKRRMVIKSNLYITPASKIPRVEGHDHFTSILHKTPKTKRRNLTTEFKSCGSVTRKRHCSGVTSPLGRSRSSSSASGASAKKRMLSSKKRENGELVKPTNTMKIFDYFARVQHKDNQTAASSSSQ